MSMCDCERGHNGLGMVVRECDCGPDEPPFDDPCPECGTQMVAKWSGVECPKCRHTECY
jgi:hypothetical protein